MIYIVFVFVNLVKKKLIILSFVTIEDVTQSPENKGIQTML